VILQLTHGNRTSTIREFECNKEAGQRGEEIKLVNSNKQALNMNIEAVLGSRVAACSSYLEAPAKFEIFGDRPAILEFCQDWVVNEANFCRLGIVSSVNLKSCIQNDEIFTLRCHRLASRHYLVVPVHLSLYRHL
jgi:hypothetical protein